VSSYKRPEGHQMMAIEGGGFTMGSLVNEPAGQQRKLSTGREFPACMRFATKEVTNQKFNRFMEAVPDCSVQPLALVIAGVSKIFPKCPIAHKSACHGAKKTAGNPIPAAFL